MICKGPCSLLLNMRPAAYRPQQPVSPVPFTSVSTPCADDSSLPQQPHPSALWQAIVLPWLDAEQGLVHGLHRAVKPKLAGGELDAGQCILSCLLQVGDGSLIYPSGQVDERWRHFMERQIERTRKYFAQAEAGVDFLDKDARWPVWCVALSISQQICAVARKQ